MIFQQFYSISSTYLASEVDSLQAQLTLLYVLVPSIILIIIIIYSERNNP